MPVTETWTDPSTGGALDLATDQVLSEQIWDALLSNLKHLGGTLGTIAVRTFNNLHQSLANATYTVLSFDGERIDTDNMRDAAVPSRITCRTAGRYLLGLNVGFASNATGIRIAQLRLNNATVLAQDNRPAVSGAATEMCLVTPYTLAVNDFIDAIAYQNSGAALNVEALSDHTPCLWAIREGA